MGVSATLNTSIRSVEIRETDSYSSLFVWFEPTSYPLIHGNKCHFCDVFALYFNLECCEVHTTEQQQKITDEFETTCSAILLKLQSLFSKSLISRNISGISISVLIIHNSISFEILVFGMIFWNSH